MAYAPQLDEAIRLIDRQDPAGAQRVLARYLQATPRDEYAWLWLAYVLPDRLQQQQALQQCLKFFPNSYQAQHNLDSLRLGLPLERPNPPPNAPTHAYSTFFGRDLFLPGNANEPSDLTEPVEPSPAPAYQPGPRLDDSPDRIEPRLVYPQPAAEPAPGSGWVHEDLLDASPAASRAPAAYPNLKQLSSSPGIKKSPREPKKGLQPWQIGIWGLLFFLVLAVLCGGSYYLFSQPPFSNMLGCFQAALNYEFPCPQCQTAAQACPECPKLPDCAPTPVPQPSPTAIPTAIPATAMPTLPPAPTQPPGPSFSLPAPLYYLSEVAGTTQIWRLEQDGYRYTLITKEAQSVTAFHISPVDGQLAYITRNTLVIADANGDNRRTLVVGLELPAPDDPEYRSVLLSHPRWSPEGKWIAFGQDGIQLMNPLTNETRRLQANVGPASPAGEWRTYTPLAWSPDGARLAVTVTRGDCPSLGFVSPTGEPTQDADNLPYGALLWEGASVLVAAPAMDCACNLAPGLYRLDPAAGSSATILGGTLDNAELSVFYGWPKFMPDGTLLYFYGELHGSACTAGVPSAAPLAMAVGVGEDWPLRMNLRPDAHLTGEALWAPDGSLAVITETSLASQSQAGVLIILYADGRPAIKLPVDGSSLQWGLPAR